MKKSERYTSWRVIEYARVALGAIDFDPASCELANQAIEQGGLQRAWCGRASCNPPFGGDRRREWHAAIKCRS